MKKILFSLFSFIIVMLFTQCTTPKSHRQIFKLMQKEHAASWGFPQLKPVFIRCRKSAIALLPRNAFENDTIIIKEIVGIFPTQSYESRVYESKSKNIYQYIFDLQSKKEFLEKITDEDSIFIMAMNNQLEEIKRRGEKPRYTPNRWLIVSMITKDSKNRFMIKSIKTNNFYFRKNYNYKGTIYK